MKHKIIIYAILLILTGGSTLGPVWADPEENTNIVLSKSIQGVTKPNGLSKDGAGFPTKVSGGARLAFKNPGRWFPGRVVNLDLFAYNLQDVLKFRMDVKYDPQQLKLVNVSRGAFLVEDQGLARWNRGVIDAQKGLAAEVSGIRYQPFSGDETTLIRLNFIVIGPGKGRISLENTKVVSSNGIERAFDFTPLEYEIVREIHWRD